MAYKLTLTRDDWRTIEFVGGRYAWSESLRKELGDATDLAYDDEDLDYIDYKIDEVTARKLKDEFDSDTIGGHAMFPMLDTRSGLYDKLWRFYLEVV